MTHQSAVAVLLGAAAVALLASDRLFENARLFCLSLVVAEVYPLSKFLCNSHNGVVLGNFPHGSKAFFLIKLGGKLIVAITLATSTRDSWVRDTVMLAAIGFYYSLNCLVEALSNTIVLSDDPAVDR